MSRPRRKGLEWLDLLRLSLGALGTNKLRSSLTILGVSIGVFSVVGVMTALAAIRSEIDSSLNVFGANVLQISREPAIQLQPGPRNNRRERPMITPRQAGEFKESMEEFGITVTLSARDENERAGYGETLTDARIDIVGTNENFLVTNNYELDFGRMLAPADLEFNRAVAVIGSELLEELFPQEDPLDKQIKLDGERYTVVGVLEERGENFGQSMDGIALIPHTKFVANNWHSRRSMSIAVQAESVDALGPAEDQAVGLMRIVRGLEPEDENDFEITTNQALQSAFEEIAVIVGLAGLLVSGIALVCAGIGIMNIMLVSVTERTREIGILKALGARKANVLLQFLLEAIFLSELGAAAGILLGVVVGNVLASQLGAAVMFPWFWAAVSVTLCSLIGIGFGFFPALRAAKLAPVEALRYE